MNENFSTQSKNSLTGKLVVLAVLIAISWIATMFVWNIVQERDNRQTEAADEISGLWSRPQVVAGPVLTIPVETTNFTNAGERIVSSMTLTLLPQNLSYNSQIETQLLKRGVYDTPVYTTLVNASGNFDLSDIEQTSPGARILWDQAAISINVSDTRGVSSAVTLKLDGKEYEMLPSSKFTTLDDSGIHADVAINPKQPNYTFSFELPLKGSREISFLPLGENTNARVSSNWRAPSFSGEFLPENRTITGDGFEANWKIASYGKNIPQSWLGSATIDTETLQSKAFGVGLYQEVNLYTMIDRATKYSMLFISLTFLTFFMYEVLSGLRIHPMQYLLVGLAIALFYLLLLSFAEIIGFLSAYLVAATSITVLISGYCFSVLKAKRRALTIATLLTALYSYLYILLQMDQYSLLFGSVLIFGVLTTVMFITRNLDWYSLNDKRS